MLLLVALAAGYYWYSNRPLGGAREMVACLPQGAETVVSLDVDGVRRSGLLDVVAGSRNAEDAEYKAFIAGTGFDYRRDLERAAGAFRSGDAFFVLTGRFDWAKLRAYTKAQGGNCRDDGFCRLHSTQSGRWTSFYQLRPKAMALAFSSNEFAALDIAVRAAGGAIEEIPTAPVWARIQPSAVASTKVLSGAQSFASPLAAAQDILLLFEPSGSDLQLKLDVRCPSDAVASDLLVKLEGATNMLRKMIEREHQKPNPGDLSGLLTSGSFQREGSRLRGVWPVKRELIESLATGAMH